MGPKLSKRERHQLIAMACRAPADFGFQRVLWEHSTPAIAVMSAGLVRSIGSGTVGRILEDAQSKPHCVKMGCHSDDPAYQETMRAIVDLYIIPPKGEPVPSIDEKTEMRALSRRRPLRPAASRRDARFVVHYATTHGSWLNQIELWFCILTRRIPRYGNFHSPGELATAVTAFIGAWNETDAHRFRWTYEGLPLVQ